MTTRDTRRTRGGSWGSRSWALLLVLGALLAGATAALAFWTVSVSYAPTNYALAKAASLSAPTVPTATVNSSSSITIGWTLPVTQLTGAQYKVTRTSPGGPTTVCTVSSATTSCIDSGLTGGTTYGYSVVAVLGTNWQSAAITTSATTNKASQTISFTSTAPAAAVVGGATYTPTATATSGLTVAFTIDASSSSVCTISGGAVSFTAVGTCVIDANQAGNANYLAAPQVQQSFAVAKGSQTITFTSTAPSGATVGGAAYTVTATGGASGNPVTFTLDGTSSGCSLASPTVTFTAVGTCVIDANQALSANYNAAPQVQQSFAVAKGAQTITVAAVPAAPTLGQSVVYTATVTGPANAATPAGTVTWAFGTSPVTSCGSTTPLSGSTNVATATCTITASKAGSYPVTASVATDTNYNAAGPSTAATFTVSKATPTITVAANPTAPTLGQSVVFTATVTGPTNAATPAGTVTWAFGASPVTSCASTTPLSGSTNVAAATCSITASGAGSYAVTGSVATDTNYNAAGPSTAATFTVSKATPTITVAANPTAPTLGQSVVFTATVTGPTNAATPAGTVTWAFGTSPVTSCASTTLLSGSTNVATATCSITASGAGSYAVTASVATDTDYTAAGPSTAATFTVNWLDGIQFIRTSGTASTFSCAYPSSTTTTCTASGGGKSGTLTGHFEFFSTSTGSFPRTPANNPTGSSIAVIQPNLTFTPLFPGTTVSPTVSTGSSIANGGADSGNFTVTLGGHGGDGGTLQWTYTLNSITYTCTLTISSP